MSMKINRKAIDVLKKIESSGYEAYIIGGAVRDLFLDMPSNDYDIATNMPIDKIKLTFDVLDNGVDYASVSIVVDNEVFEITHFRRDIKYTDHRHPEIELVNSLKEDVLRRDFTINALALDSNLNLYDFFEGMNDLNNNLLRAIGDANIRFEEDALRILRCLYFSSKLNFSIEKNTLNAIIDKCHLLAKLSNERIKEYFIKLIYSNNKNGINYIKNYDIFRYIPVYKRWIEVVNDRMDINDLDIYYYLAYHEYPPLIQANTKRLIKSLDMLIDNNFSLYSIFKEQDNLPSLFNVINSLGYDIASLQDKMLNLKIKNESDLALSTFKITSYFNAKEKSIAIKEVISAILENKISNKKEDILLFIQGLEVIKC